MLILIPILLPVLGGLAMFLFKSFEENDRARNIYSAAIMILTAAAAAAAVFLTDGGTLKLWSVTEKVFIAFRCDQLSKLFMMLANIMFTLVGIYAFEYMAHEEKKRRFFAFFIMVMGVLNGIYLASNLVTMYLFYELMTLISLPLVLQELTKEAISAGLKYLFYSIAGAFLSLLAIFFVYTYSSSCEFAAGGCIDGSLVAGHENLLLVFVFLAIIGFGCKAGLFPLQDWLPTAHPVAPAPASAVLSGVITKSGVVAIIRLVFYSVGASFIRNTWVQYAWIVLALLTVFLGSMMAFGEKLLKKRLAFSTVSQVSYVLFGLSTLHPVGIMGALLHVIFHSVIKDDLFMVAGVIIHNTGAVSVDSLKGIGKKMPASIWCFTFASLALVGIPPASGFISKWFLASGALSAEIGAFSYVGPAVLLLSALLTAGYLLPVTIDGFFPGKDFDTAGCVRCEAGARALVPIVILAVLSLFMGIFPSGLESFISTVISGMGL